MKDPVNNLFHSTSFYHRLQCYKLQVQSTVQYTYKITRLNPESGIQRCKSAKDIVMRRYIKIIGAS